MRSSTVLLKLCMCKVISHNPSDCWNSHSSAYLHTLQSSNFHQWKMGRSMYYLTYLPDVQLLRVLRVSFQHPVRIVVRPESAIMSIDKTIQFKNSFIWENFIENKIGVIISFFSVFIMTSQNSIRQSKSSFNSCTRWILYGWNLIFFKILCTDMRLISCCWFALWILRWTFSTNDCATSSCFSSPIADIGRPGIWRFFTLPVSLKRPLVPRWISKWLYFHREKFH